MTRRTALALSAAALPAPAQGQRPASHWSITADMVSAHDVTVDDLLKRQNTDKASPWVGGVADPYGLYNGGTVCGFVLYLVTCLTYPPSRHYASGLAKDRLKLALDYLGRKLTPDGNLDLLITNFNSPPDSAFAMYSLCTAVNLARQMKKPDLERMVAPILHRMAKGVARGGVHTPNHRWVMCAALAQAHALFPTPAWLQRLDDWLAEGIDIDADGQYSERSTAVYNAVVDRALTVTAMKLGRPQLLEPVRRNLEAMLYLLHPGYELVTEISKRQDQYTRGTVGSFWLPLRALALKDDNGVYETLARLTGPSVWELMEYPELASPGPEPKPVPTNYEKQLPAIGIARARRGLTSATMMLGGTSRLFSVRRGKAIVNAVRLASAFFGIGQFVPTRAERTADGYVWTQSIDAGYYQPFGDGTKQPVGVDEWYRLREKRQRTEVCKMDYRAELTENLDGFTLRLSATGTQDVPVAIEISLAGDGELTGCEPAADVTNGFLLASGKEAVWRSGVDQIHFGPGRMDHKYTQIRGAEPKLAGRSIYVTGFAPFDHTIKFRLL